MKICGRIEVSRCMKFRIRVGKSMFEVDVSVDLFRPCYVTCKSAVGNLSSVKIRRQLVDVIFDVR